ncbi:YdcF family protein [Streptomyces sp. NBC_00091]|uniref:YdcF family protein n=1 Tax=Streptomyces sp. NBC_00091 TaxID=2975648 RepID=UPI002257A13A|nr:YdcF family protein [Streptomyces sp. NBC_00091]MCX5378803.1 YdcF family protein [Streptomyces sp. NBC_00091]
MADERPQGITEDQRQAAQLIWDYHHMRHELRPCDAAIALGCNDLGVSTYAAHLYETGFFPTLVFTGGNSAATSSVFPRGEAVHFHEHALALGVPAHAMLLEPKAANTGQNIAFAREALTASGVQPRSVLLISMPYMERRAFATCREQWPDIEVVCASDPLSFDTYLKCMGDEESVISMIVGDLQRVIEYPKQGFAIDQDVPEDVHAAYESLVRDGFTSCLISP